MGTKVTNLRVSFRGTRDTENCRCKARFSKKTLEQSECTYNQTTQLLERQTFSGCHYFNKLLHNSFGEWCQNLQVQEVQSSVTSSGDETSCGIVSDEEIEKKELEAHYGFMEKIQEVLPAESSSTDTPLEQVQNNDENNVFANERQHSEKNAAECTDERAALVNLIANLTLDTEENKMILKQLKKANASLTQELKECRTNLDETSRALGEATSYRDSCLIALQNKQNEF
ncbi:hypothetical protein Tco_0672712 [Tanacetum coccineum]